MAISFYCGQWRCAHQTIQVFHHDNKIALNFWNNKTVIKITGAEKKTRIYKKIYIGFHQVKLVLLSFVLFFIDISTISTDLFVIFLKGSKIFTSLRELSFFHAFSHVPVDKGTLGIH